ncbi:MAG: 50S ribosomal protein L32 [Patescibacteria group bacterium]
MPVPAKRKAKSHSRSGRAHLALKSIKLASCPKCKKSILPHHTCLYCGFYKGREVIKIKSKLAKLSKSQREKKEKENE